MQNVHEKYANMYKEYANRQGKYTKLRIYFVIVVTSSFSKLNSIKTKLIRKNYFTCEKNRSTSNNV